MNPNALPTLSAKDLRILREGARALVPSPGDARGLWPAGILVMHPIR